MKSQDNDMVNRSSTLSDQKMHVDFISGVYLGSIQAWETIFASEEFTMAVFVA